jgi:hypothetical protein
MYPQIGKAGMPYAKSVRSLTQRPVPPPDASTIFDGVSHILTVIILISMLMFESLNASQDF